MSEIAECAKRFWSAALYLRRAPDRDASVALAVLRQLSTSTIGAIQSRAAATLKEQDGK